MNFFCDYQEVVSLVSCGEIFGEEDQCLIIDLLIDQVEFVDVILVSKIDLIFSEQCEELLVILCQFNVEVEILLMVMGQVLLVKIFDIGCFDFDCVVFVLGWLKELCGEYLLEIEEYGIVFMVYWVCWLFYFVCFYVFLYNLLKQGWLLCFKGFFWFVSWFCEVGSWLQVGGLMCYGLVGCWWCFVLIGQWLQDEEGLWVIMWYWEEGVGDCCQELVFIGQNLDFVVLCVVLDVCLLDDVEMNLGIFGWQGLDDFFEDWGYVV